jgi:hypothetical protein
MKVCAVSPWETASTNDILDFLRETTAELVVLPGVSKSKNTPSREVVQRVIRPGVAVFVQNGESKDNTTPYLVTCDRAEPMPPQIFKQSPTAKCMDDLVAAWPDRTFPIGSRTVTFAICGEINGFNPNADVKHGRVLPFDILANPTHTVMGRWQHLGPKLSALSKGKMVVHVANNNRNHERLSTDLRIYINGNLQEAKLQCAGRLKWCECEI